MQERLAKLAGGVAVIRVGGATEVEVREKKDRVDDVLHATKASRNLAELNPANGDQKMGIDIIRRAVEWPARQIAENAGAEGAIVIGKLIEKRDPNWGYDAQEGEFKDLCKAGIIDPAKVVRAALQDAASVAGLVITTEAGIANKPEPAPHPHPPQAGMDF